MTILTLTPTLLDEILDRSSALSLLVSIQSASSLLQSVTHQLILCRPKKHSMKRSSNDVIRWETRTIVDIVQTVESLVTGGIMLNDHQVKTLIWNSTKGFRSSFLWWYQASCHQRVSGGPCSSTRGCPTGFPQSVFTSLRHVA